MAHGDNPEELALRRRARDEHAEVVRRRMARHQAIALRLTGDPGGAADLICEARAMVARWRAERLCSDDYCNEWAAILAKQPKQIAAAIVSDAKGWDALRQCSPFVGGASGG